LRRAFFAALLAGLTTTSAALGQSAPAPPPPNPIAPLFTVNVPALFQWTAVNPGTVYNIIVAQRGRSTSALALPQVTYELQISDRLDIASRTLFDVTVSQPSFLFTNQYVPNGGFTINQPFGQPLSGGTYYWRVRGIVGGVFTAFTTPQQFVLQLPAGGGGSTPIHAMGITGLAVAGQPIEHVGSAVLFVLQNLGTYTEASVPYVVSVNGAQLFSGQTGAMAPGRSVQVSTQWTPDRAGPALVNASLTFPGLAQARTNSSITVIVDQQAAILTTIVGDVRRAGTTYVLVDARGRELAILVPNGGTRIDLPSFVDQHVVVAGSLTKTGDGFIFAVRNINTTR
jgi:hypothetical protein